MCSMKFNSKMISDVFYVRFYLLPLQYVIKQQFFTDDICMGYLYGTMFTFN